MSEKSSIEWTSTLHLDGTITQGSTWNPVRGCDKVSPGCTRCYAETFSERWRGVKGHPFEQGFDLRLVPEKLQDPLKWKKGRKIFVNSMSDLFHEEVPVEYIKKVFDVMLCAPQHTYQILTKRHDRMLELMSGPLREYSMFPHIWLGVSAENEKYGVPRVRALIETPSAVKFVSCEPLIGPLDLRPYLYGLNWIIVGGESGHGCRPMDIDWAYVIQRDCQVSGVPYFLKQLGGFPDKRHKLSDLPEDLRVRQFPKSRT